MIGAVIVCHGDFAASLLWSASTIAGEIDNIAFVSNAGLSTGELVTSIREKAEELSCDDVLYFVDIYGGSCWQAAKIAGGEHGVVITGINLPMLLSFIHKRSSLPLDKISAVMEEDGKRGIRSI